MTGCAILEIEIYSLLAAPLVLLVLVLLLLRGVFENVVSYDLSFIDARFSGWTFRTGFKFLIFGRSKLEFGRLRTRCGFRGSRASTGVFLPLAAGLGPQV